jgi:chorismate dehydratase
MRIGAVNYLNSKPLVCSLEEIAPEIRLSYDLPSRLADSLAAGRLDAALVPSVEYFRTRAYHIVSDACVACAGPVLSVKLYFRVPPQEVQRVALDEGSRTSSALAQIMLAELCDVLPEFVTLPIGCGLESTDADAVLLIGDRAMQYGQAESVEEEVLISNGGMRRQVHPSQAVPGRLERQELHFVEVWDLGNKWYEWMRLPFVFAMWIARPEVQSAELATVLNLARDEGIRQLSKIAARESAILGISGELALRYLRENLHFQLGNKECAGLRKFYQLCVTHGLAPAGLESTLESYTCYGCAAK